MLGELYAVAGGVIIKAGAPPHSGRFFSHAGGDVTVIPGLVVVAGLLTLPVSSNVQVIGVSPAALVWVSVTVDTAQAPIEVTDAPLVNDVPLHQVSRPAHVSVAGVVDLVSVIMNESVGNTGTGGQIGQLCVPTSVRPPPVTRAAATLTSAVTGSTINPPAGL